ncbi:MAG TPA: type II toxin-antitoxin system VapC family toxin [Caulobacteraceae bacterium]|nr:type II toxin-antitoxin system VapC family toxin [Caulobacteraceae bacterium]
MSFYLDASVIVPTLAAQSMSHEALAFLNRSPGPFSVSDLCEAEVAAAASRMVRMSILTADRGVAMLHRFDTWLAAEGDPVATETSDFRAAIVLVRRFELKLRTPDALHLAISARLGAQLVTFDRRLALAAQAVGLTVHTPS